MTYAVSPRFAIPNHYDMMALNAENPETFDYFMRQENPTINVKILELMKPFAW